MSSDDEKCSKLVKKCLSMKESSRDLIIRLIKRIEIHEDKTINVYFNFKKLNILSNI